VIKLFVKLENVNDSMGIMLIRLSTGLEEVDVCRKIFFTFHKTVISISLFFETIGEIGYDVTSKRLLSMSRFYLEVMRC
jgi:hypothetical protein